MSGIKGTIATIGDFLFQKEVTVYTEYNGTRTPALQFFASRNLLVPKYQREIRWQKETLFSLMHDIFHGGKFLGNIILSDCNDGNYNIIDGQQRIVSLCMLVNYIKQNFSEEIDDIPELTPVKLNCFEKFSDFQNNNYSLTGIDDDKKSLIIESDELHQIETLTELYTSIKKSDIFR